MACENRKELVDSLPLFRRHLSDIPPFFGSLGMIGDAGEDGSRGRAIAPPKRRTKPATGFIAAVRIEQVT